MTYQIDSKEEIAEKGFDRVACAADDYISRILAIRLVATPAYKDRSKLEWAYELVLTPVKVKSGDPMVTSEGAPLEPFSHFVSRQINPLAVGFMKGGATPTFMRALISYIEQTDPNERLTPPDFVLASKDMEEIKDSEWREKVLLELSGKSDKDILNTGAIVFPDIRSYVGRYIGTDISVNEKGYNRIERFTKVPASFVAPEAIEKEKELFIRADKFIQSKLERFGQASQAPQASGAMAEELPDDVDLINQVL